MAIKTFTAGSVLTAADTNTYLANAGTIVVVPTSVSNGTIISGTGSATANSAVSTLTLNGVFSSTFDSYRIVISNLTMSSTAASTVIYVKMHDGTNPANSNYNFGIAAVDMANGAYSGSIFASSGTNGIAVGRGTGDKFGTSFDIVNPFLATHTVFPQISYTAISTGYSGSGAGMHQSSISYTGFQILPSTGTLTGGNITVYGYRK